MSVFFKLWCLSEIPGQPGENAEVWAPSYSTSLVLLVFISFSCGSESHRSLRITELCSICCCHPHNLPVIPIIMGSSGKLCWPFAVQKIKLRLFEGHRISQSLGWPKNPILLPTIPMFFTVLPTHTNTIHSLNYCISSNWASAIVSLFCKFDFLILENPFLTSLPRKSYHPSRLT